MPPLFQLDDYESCLQDKSSYCVIRLDLFADPPNDVIRLVKEYSEFTTRHYNHTYIERGVCLATRCKKYINGTNSLKSWGLNTALEECINKTISNDYGLQAKLTHIYYCDEKTEDIKYDWSDLFFGGIMMAVLAANIVGSLYDIMCVNKDTENQHGCENPYFLCFSIFKNWNYMTSTKCKDTRLERLNGIHGIRALVSFLIPIAHVMWLIGTGFTDNPRDLEKTSESIHYQLIFNGMMIVQIFFVISGFLMVYNMQIYSETVDTNWSSVPMICLKRWCRLTPMNALMIAFTASWMRHLGSGPLWNLYVTGVTTDCRNYWWAHIFYFNNYIPEDKFCAVQSWHIASDMQLFIVGVIIYVATNRGGRIITLSLLLLLSMATPAIHVWLQDLDGVVIITPEFYRSFNNATYRDLHVLGHNNLACPIIGMIAGLLAYNWQKKQINIFKGKLWRYLTWLLVPAIVGLFLTGRIFYVKGERPSVLIRMIYAAVHRGILGIIIAFLIVGMVCKVENVQRRFLEWNGWKVPSNLSYCAYLLHINIVHLLLGTRTQLAHVSFLFLIINHLGVVTLSFMAAIPFYIMVEVPFTQLIKILFPVNTKSLIKKE